MEFTEDQIAQLNRVFADRPAPDLLSWALRTFGNTVALSCGFGLEGLCLLDMLMEVDRNARVFTLDTGRLPKETYDLMERCEEHYGIKFEVYFPEQSEVEQMIRSYGINLFYKSREFRRLCCHVRKVRPLMRALTGLHAWITGLRRGQSEERADVQPLELDQAHGRIVKINPLANWPAEKVWEYVRARGLPYNTLHDRDYPSIGCAPCTRAIGPGDDLRAGRWWWELDGNKECGLHR